MRLTSVQYEYLRATSRLFSRQVTVVFCCLLGGLFLLGASALADSGELDATLSIDPYPSPFVSDWAAGVSIGQASVTNKTDTNLTVRVSVRLVRSGYGQIASAQSQALTFGPGAITTINTDELTDYGTYDYDNSLKSQIQQTGRLPEGDYEFCLDFEDEFGVALLSNVCATFTIVDPEAPALLFPFDAEILEDQYPSFQWTPIQAPVSYGIRYQLKIVELLDGQVASQALAANFAHYQNSTLTESNLVYPIDAIELVRGHTYVWQIQALNENNQPATSNNGYSEIWTFVFAEDETEETTTGETYTIDIAPAGSLVSGVSLPDLDISTFEEVRDSWNSFKSGEAVTIPIPGMGTFERFKVPNVQVAINDTLKMITFRGRTERFNEPAADVLLTLRWKGLKSAATICVKLPSFSFGGAFVEFASYGRFEELALDFSVIGFSNRNEKLSSAIFPESFADYFGDQEVELKPGMNFHGVIALDRTPWFERLVNVVGIEDNRVILKGYGGPVKNLLTKKTAKDFELSLSAQFPAIMSKGFRLWLNSRQYELEGGIKRALDSTKTADTLGKNDTTVAKYTPFLKLTETLKGGFFEDRELTFFRSLELEKTIGDSSSKVTVQYGSKDVLHFGVPWLNIRDITLSLEGEDEKASATLTGAIDIGSVKLADSVLIGIGYDKSKTDTSTVNKNESSLKGRSVGGSRSKGKTKYRLKATLSNNFTLSDIAKIVKTIHPEPFLDIGGGGGGGLSEFFDISDLAFGMNGGEEREIFFSGKTVLGPTETDLLISLIKDSYGKRFFTLGVKPISWKLTEVIPALSNPVLDNVDFSNVGFVFTNKETRIESADLGIDTYEFYQGVYGGMENYSLRLTPGINIVAVIPLEDIQPDDPLAVVMSHLGMEAQVIIMQGNLGDAIGLISGKSGGALGAIKDVHIKAGLPPIKPPGSPEWFVEGEVALEVTGLPSVGVVGSITVDIKGDRLTFYVAGKISKDMAGVQIGMVGGLETEKPWEAPFGIKFLTINSAAVKLSVNAVGNFGLGFAGDLVIGEKDIDVAVAIMINASGVPVNAIFDGESEAGVGMSDLVMLQSKMAAAVHGGEPRMLPVSAIPDMALKQLKLKFAPKDEPDLNVERGMALGGNFYLATSPGEDMSLFAAVDCEISEEGIFAYGSLAEFSVGPLTWNDGLLDFALALGESRFIVDGEVELFESHKQIKLQLTRDSLAFHTETDIQGLYASELDVRGIFDFKKPSLQVHGKMQSQFSEALEKPLADGLALFASSTEVAIVKALEAYETAEKLHGQGQQAVDSLLTLLRPAKDLARGVMLSAKKIATNAYNVKMAAKRAMNGAYRSFRNTPRRKVALKAQRWRGFVAKRSVYWRKAAIHSAKVTAYRLKIAAYNSVPDPDNGPVIKALKGKADELWAELRRQKVNLEKLKALIAKINSYLEKSGIPIKIVSAEFDASMRDLIEHKGVSMRMELEYLGEPRTLEMQYSFGDVKGGVQEIVDALLGS